MLNKLQKKIRRANRVRFKLSKSKRMRITVYRSNKNFSVQIIDQNGVSRFGLSTSDKRFREIRGGMKYITVDQVERFADFFKEVCPKEYKGEHVVFDRGGYIYSGKVRSFAENVRGFFNF
ncbi:MAG: 50S ribosomal protein L18 [Candidatus Xenolissoclinum pacificiensis L6]|uniref:50S ribosomal protein L18 n=1 Tax=Candidatus Xenolissoclinum pacificiensis L6 TaxID=1401685 RepID=W2UZC1_9RICK|nr:MAG: 50S ribosomal protein L18 [Candidatus Xenolissoclinum pacificiensis L6]